MSLNLGTNGVDGRVYLDVLMTKEVKLATALCWIVRILHTSTRIFTIMFYGTLAVPN